MMGIKIMNKKKIVRIILFSLEIIYMRAIIANTSNIILKVNFVTL